MRQFRFIFIAIFTSLFVINAVFWRKTTAVLLCGVLSFNSTSCYSFLGDYGKADATVSPSNSTVAVSKDASSTQKDEQKVAICVFGVCADTPKIPIPSLKLPSRDQPNPTASPQQPTNVEQQQPTASNNEKPTTDLTGNWVGDRLGSICRVDSCILAPPPVPSLKITDNAGRVVTGLTITQSGNQISIPDLKFVWDGGHYTYRYTGGNISGNKVTLYETAVDTSVGWGYTNIYTGTVSADGNTVEGEVVYQPSAGNNGNNTAKTKFTWKRKQADKKELLPEPGDVVVYQTSAFHWSPGKCTDQGCTPPQIPPSAQSYYPHVAVIIKDGVKKNPDGTVTITRVRSKWGGGAVYDHNPNQTLSYGKNWTVWHRILKKTGCVSEECNWLEVGKCDGHDCFKTDKKGNIHPGGTLEKGVTSEHPLPGVDRVDLPKNLLLYDCRGFVFGRKLAQISEYFLYFNQVQEILDDGYTQIQAKDTEGIRH